MIAGPLLSERGVLQAIDDQVALALADTEALVVVALAPELDPVVDDPVQVATEDIPNSRDSACLEQQKPLDVVGSLFDVFRYVLIRRLVWVCAVCRCHE